MKIFVSLKFFDLAPQYKKPMQNTGMCIVDDKLKLGQIRIEFDDTETFINLNTNKSITTDKKTGKITESKIDY